MSYSQMSDLYQQVNGLQQALATVQTVETPGAYLTLTRSATLALVTTGTVITWQSALRAQGISWSGTTVTIPTDGYYHLAVSISLAAATNTYIRIVLNGANSLVSYAVPFSTGGGYAAATAVTLYLREADTFTVALNPAVATTLNQNGEGYAAPSPMLHVVQLSGVL